MRIPASDPLRARRRLGAKATGPRLLALGAVLLALSTVVGADRGWTEPASPLEPGHHQHHRPVAPAIAAALALSRARWIVTADSQQAGFPASNVLDGDPATLWHTRFEPTPAPLPHSLTIDMRDTNIVSGLHYRPRADGGLNGTIGRYQIHLSTDGGNWGNPVTTGTFTNDQTEKSVAIPATATRFVKLTALTEAGDRGHWTSASEINITGHPAPNLNRAGWTVNTDSAQPEFPASNAVDGNPSTIWHTQFEPTLAALPHTMTIDMGDTNIVSALHYLPRADGDRNGNIGGYQVHLSTDGTSWGNPIATGTFADDATEKSIPFPPTTARYVRLTALTEAGGRGSWTSASEINLTGNPAPNLNRSGWTATTDSQQHGFPAGNALDSNPGSIWHTRFWPTTAALPHSITIDMHDTNVVSGLRYQPRVDGSLNGTIGRYQIHLSTNGTTWGNPVTTGTFADDAREKTVAVPPTSTRYVRLTALTEAGGRGHWISAAELNLTGSPPPFDPSTQGNWGATIGFPLVPVGAGQLPDGRLLTWSAYSPYDFQNGSGGMTQTATMNLADAVVSSRTVTETGHDMFCPGTAYLPDGRIMITGGNGSTKTSLYQPATDSWAPGQPMERPRGYQSMVTLSDGRVFTLGGSWTGAGEDKDGAVWSADTGWRALPNVPVGPILTADPFGPYRSDNHAWFFAISDGRVFHAGPSKQLNLFDTNGNGSSTPAGNRGDDQDAMNGTAVMYDIGKILTVGGAPAYENADASNRAYVIDVNNGVRTRRVGSMEYARAFHNSVVLPDGKVLVVGGQSRSVPFSDAASVFNAELWDPATERFTTMATMAAPRNYHSVGVLLPDGRVFSGGGGLCGDCGTNHLDAQLFSPPYLFAADGSPAPRPAITGAPNEADAGSNVTVTTDRAVSAFSLVRLGAVTHSVNTDQRRVPLSITATNGTSYTVAVPGDRGVAVPGYYMLFALDQNGVPSVATTVRIR